MNDRSTKRRSIALRVALIYLLIGSTGVLVTDRLLHAVVADPVLRADLGTLIGLVLVVAAAGVMYALVRAYTPSLQASEGQLRALFAAMTDVILVLDDQGRYRQIAPTNPALLYRPTAELIGKALHEVFPPEQATLFLDSVRRALTTRQTINLDYVLTIAEQEVWFTCAISPMNDTTVVWVARDITATKLAEEAIKRSRQEYEALLHSIDSIVWEADAQTFQFTFVSQQAERVLGYPLAQWTSEPTFWQDHIHPDDRAPAVNFYLAETQAKRDHQFEYRMIAADRRSVWLRNLVTVVVDNERPVTLRGVMVDVTAAKMRARELEVIAATASALRAAPTRAAMLPIILDQLTALLQVDAAVIGLCDPHTTELVVEGARGSWAASVGARVPAAGDGLIADIMRASLRSEPRILQPDARRDVRAVSTAPLIAHDQTIGVLAVGRATTISDEETRLLQAIGDMAASALHRVIAHEQAQRRAEQLATVNILGRALAELLDLPHVCAHLSTAITQLLPDIATTLIALFDPARQLITWVYGLSDGELLDAAQLPMQSPGTGPQSEAIRTRQPLIVGDFQDRLKTTPPVITPGSSRQQSALYAPMLAKGDVIGVVQVHSDTPNRFTQEDAELLTFIANTAAVAIQNAELFESERRQRERAEALAHLAARLNAQLGLGAVLHTLCDEVTRALHAPAASIYLHDPARDALIFGGSAGLPADFGARAQPISRALYDAGAAQAQPLIVMPDIRRVPGLLDAALYTQYGIVTVVGAPLLRDDQLVGLLTVQSFDDVRAFTVDEQALITTFADQAAIAIQNAQLLEAEHAQRTLAEALRDTSAVLNSTLNFDEVLDRMLTNIERVVPHDAANIMLLGSDGIVSIARCRGYDQIAPGLEALVRALRFPIGDIPILHRMMMTREPCIISDTGAYPHWIDTPATHWVKSYIGAPIRLRDSVVGLINLDSATPIFFTPTDADRLQAFANQAAIAIENSRLFEGESEQRTLAEALRDTAIALNGTLNSDEVLDRILSSVGRIVPNDVAGIFQIEAGVARLMRVLGNADPHQATPARAVPFAIADTPHLHRMVETGQPLVIPDVKAEPEWIDVPELRWIRSYVGAPIWIKGRIGGVVSLESAMSNFFTPVHAERLQIFAAQAAVAIESAQLFDETQRRMKELAALYDSSLAITATLDRSTVLHSITQRLAEVVDATSVYVLSVDWENSTVTIIAEYFGPDANELERMSDLGMTLPLNDYPQTIELLRAGQPSMALISQPEIDPAAVMQMQLYGGQSSLRVPFMVAGQMRTYAVIWDSRTGRIWTDAEMKLCQTLANQAAVALENVRLFEETQKRLTEQSALLAASTAISSSLDLPIVLQRLAEQMGRAIDATSVYICNWDPYLDTTTVLADYYGPAALPHERVSDLGTTYQLRGDLGLDSSYLREARVVIANVDDPDMPEFNRAHLQRYGGQSVLSIPLAAKGTVFGYAELWESRRRREFTRDEISLCQTMAQQAALAFDNARLFEAERKQLRLAQTLQAVGALLTAQMGLDAVYEYLFDLLARVVRYDSVSVQLLDGERMVLAAGRGFPDLGIMSKIIQSIAKQTLEERWGQQHQRVVVIPDTHTDPRWDVAPGSEYIRSWIGAALRVKGQLLGILNVNSRTVNAYDDDAAETVAAFANQAAIAIENAQLHEAVRRHADELEQRVIERTAELERERKRTAAVLDTAGEGIMLTDADGTIEYMNPAIQRLTGFSAAEARGQNPRLWQSGKTSPALYYQMWSRVKRGEIWQGELINRRKDGVFYDAALTVAPLSDDAGRIVGFVGVQRDITHQKELDRLKDEFVSNVSHELRTPIANVKLYLSLLTRGKPEKYDEYLQTLWRETARLQKLIEDLLDLSRFDLGTTEIALVPTDLIQLTAQLIADRSALAAHRQLTIDYQAEADRVMALADPAMLIQVVSNLLTNAINYTPPGGAISVTIGQQPRDDRAWATFTVKDTGPGISAADVPHLFERFYRGEAGRKSGAPGTGLGLAISHKIIDRMDGRITVDSRPGQGAAFTVWLRLVTEL